MPTLEQNKWLSDQLGVKAVAALDVHQVMATAEQGTSPATQAAPANAMQPDCEIVRNKVPDLVNHVLCGTHGHILDINARTIIAKDLDEYKRKHPAPPRPKPAAPAATGANGHAPATTAQGATAPSVPPPAPADVKPVKIPIPPVTGNDKADTEAQLGVLDTLKPIKDDPAHYTVVIGGQTVTVPKDAADKIVSDAKQRMKNAITKINDLCALALDDYANQKSVNDDQKVVSGAVRAFKFVTSLGHVHDPKDDIDRLVGVARMNLATATGLMNGGGYRAAAGLIADAEGAAMQAGKVARVWSNALVDGASSMVTGLTHTRNISFGVVSGLAAIGTGGVAGVVAAAVLPTAADITGKAIAGQKIDWAGAVIEVSVNLLVAKFGGQAEGAIKAAVGKQVAKKLAGKVSAAMLDKIGEKAGEMVAKKLVDKGSEVLKSVTKTAAAKFQGKDMTFDEFVQEVLKDLNNPDGKESAAAQGLTEKLLKDAVAAVKV